MEDVRPDHRGDDEVDDDDDVRLAVEALQELAATRRFGSRGCGADDPDWTTSDGVPVADHVRREMDGFRHDLDDLAPTSMHRAVFERHTELAHHVVAGTRWSDLRASPQPRDLLRVYGPDRDNTRDAARYYRWAWTDEGPHAITYSDEAQVVREGKLAALAYSYSGQSSHALVGAGFLFRPLSNQATISIRPYVRWLTSASFTGNAAVPASAAAHVGIFVQSWDASSRTGVNVDRDHWITLFSRDTRSYTVGLTADGTATVADGLSVETLAVRQRRYGIFVYTVGEVSAAPSNVGNEIRYVHVEIDAAVPFVVVEETPLA